MLALVVISVFMTAIAMALTTAMRSNRSDTNRMVSSNLAATLMDEVRAIGATDFDELLAKRGTETIEGPKTMVNGVQYTAKRTIDWVPGNGTFTNCGSGTDAANVAYLRVDIAVSWPNMGAVKPVTNSTLVAPPVGQFNTATGAVATQVTDNEGNPQSGVTVQLLQGATGSTVAETQSTTAQGCAFFPFLDSGTTYRLRISKAGYVDIRGVTQPESAATLVTTGAVTSIPPFIYERASTITATITPTATAYMPNQLIPITLSNSLIQPGGLRFETGTGTSTARTLPTVFPFSDGYSAWPGWCKESDPDAYLDEPTDPSLRAPLIPVTPGGTSATALSVPTLNVLVRRSNGTLRVGQAITLYYAGPDTSCTPPNVTFGGVTDATGRISVAIPYGTWQVRANSRTASGGWPTIQVTPQNSNPSQLVTVVTT